MVSNHDAALSKPQNGSSRTAEIPKGKEEPSGDYSPAELPQNNRQLTLELTIGTVLLSGKHSTHTLPAEEAFLIILFC
ncbi:MAG: hypothetical protein E6552_07605, partial [Sutterella wadsworthensis]|nr:hypothetical protein [Sutterella wadsworthensis]